jgi:hypothetical protein
MNVIWVRDEENNLAVNSKIRLDSGITGRPIDNIGPIFPSPAPKRAAGADTLASAP